MILYNNHVVIVKNADHTSVLIICFNKNSNKNNNKSNNISGSNINRN